MAANKASPLQACLPLLLILANETRSQSPNESAVKAARGLNVIFHLLDLQQPHVEP